MNQVVGILGGVLEQWNAFPVPVKAGKLGQLDSSLPYFSVALASASLSQPFHLSCVLLGLEWWDQ